ncbi:hypothetical protein BDR04DRAFT_1145490 [Suillus decipiens]|nr:hypothetical protein BDR04DRAFT_1145490 [Suillus decipiens]
MANDDTKDDTSVRNTQQHTRKKQHSMTGWMRGDEAVVRPRPSRRLCVSGQGYKASGDLNSGSIYVYYPQLAQVLNRVDLSIRVRVKQVTAGKRNSLQSATECYVAQCNLLMNVLQFWIPSLKGMHTYHRLSSFHPKWHSQSSVSSARFYYGVWDVMPPTYSVRLFLCKNIDESKVQHHTSGCGTVSVDNGCWSSAG